MIVVLDHDATAADVAEVAAALKARGLETRVVRSGGRTLLHVVSGSTRRARAVQDFEQVAALMPTSGPRVRREGRRLFPYHFLQWSALAIALLGVLVFLAGTIPPGIGEAVDVERPPEDLEQPAYVRALAGLVSALPAPLVWPVALLAAAAILLLPCIDRDPARTFRQRLPIVAIGTALIAALVYFASRGLLA
jgi:hypothetical protein